MHETGELFYRFTAQNARRVFDANRAGDFRPQSRRDQLYRLGPSGPALPEAVGVAGHNLRQPAGEQVPRALLFRRAEGAGEAAGIDLKDRALADPLRPDRLVVAKELVPFRVRQDDADAFRRDLR